MLRSYTKGSTLVLVLFLALIAGMLWLAHTYKLQDTFSTLFYGDDESATSTGKAPQGYQTPLDAAHNAGQQLQNSQQINQ